jgi:hypothetical protein
MTAVRDAQPVQYTLLLHPIKAEMRAPTRGEPFEENVPYDRGYANGMGPDAPDRMVGNAGGTDDHAAFMVYSAVQTGGPNLVNGEK